MNQILKIDHFDGAAAAPNAHEFNPVFDSDEEKLNAIRLPHSKKSKTKRKVNKT